MTESRRRFRHEGDQSLSPLPSARGGPALSWEFVVADVATAILGEDFLSHHRLAVDVKHQTLRDTTGRANGTPAAIRSLGLWAVTCDTPYRSLLSGFPSITAKPTEPTPVRHSGTHHIATSGLSRVSRPRRMAPERLTIARREFEKLHQLEVIRQSKSSWSLDCTWPPMLLWRVAALW